MRRYLDATKKGEHDEGHEQAEDGHGASDVGDDRQRRLVAGIQITRVEIHQNGEVGQVIAATHRVRLVGGQHPAALVAPRADRVVPEDARRIGHVLLAEVLQADGDRLRKLDVSAFAQRCGYDARVDDPRHVAVGRLASS